MVTLEGVWGEGDTERDRQTDGDRETETQTERFLNQPQASPQNAPSTLAFTVTPCALQELGFGSVHIFMIPLIKVRAWACAY